MSNITEGTEQCNVNLDKCDTYEDFVVPDEDVETTLKVIRTLRDLCLDPHAFDADGAVVLSHAHAKIVEFVKGCM